MRGYKLTLRVWTTPASSSERSSFMQTGLAVIVYSVFRWIAVILAIMEYVGRGQTFNRAVRCTAWLPALPPRVPSRCHDFEARCNR